MTAYELVLSRLQTDTPTRRFLEATLQNPSWVVTIIAGCEQQVGCVLSYDSDVGIERHMSLLAELAAVLPVAAAEQRIHVVATREGRVYVMHLDGSAAMMVVHATVFGHGWHLVVAVRRRAKRQLMMTIYT